MLMPYDTPFAIFRAVLPLLRHDYRYACSIFLPFSADCRR